MAEATGKGSIIFKIIIVLLIAVVLMAVLYPQKQWKAQAEEEESCRLHMENIYYSSLQYLKKHKTFIDNLNSLISFMETDSLLAPPGLFEIERLTVWESPRDSFLVGFPDLYHYQRLDWEFIGPESLSMTLIPKERFSLVPESRMHFHSDDSIFVLRREKGIEDIYVYVWGKSRIRYERMASDSALIPTKYFAVSEDPEDFRICPTIGTPHKISTNVRVKLTGEIEYRVLRKEGGNVSEDEFLRNLFIKKLKSDAAVEALRVIKSDTTLFIKKADEAKVLVLGVIPPDTVEMSEKDSTRIATVRDSLLVGLKDSLLYANFSRNFAALKPRSKILMEEEIPKIIHSDSVAAWEDSLRIRNLLFSLVLDEKEQELASSEDIQAMFNRLEAKTKYYIAGIDTVGLTISCPIDSAYIKKDKSILERIFGVGPTPNHGEIENGDYSWEEKK